MCSRYALISPPGVFLPFWISLYEGETKLMPSFPEVGPRYNIAPTQAVLVVRGGAEPTPELMRWGLIPPWAKDDKGAPQVNARSETLFELPTFRDAAHKRRCLVPADGFFEWLTVGKEKQPHFFQLTSEEPFAFAGLWERWQGPQGELHSCTIITTTPNELVAPIHTRMPVILPPEAYATWLDPNQQDPTVIQPLLAPFPAERMKVRPVNKRMGSSKYDDPSVLAPPDPPGGPLFAGLWDGG